jgi:F-type H+-transporting ATPase subunit gamma
MDTLESLHRKLEGAKELGSVVRTMKAMAAANVGQYEISVLALGDYFRTVSMGIFAYFKQEKINSVEIRETPPKKTEKIICAIVFGSDQGLVGKFNDLLKDFVLKSFDELNGIKNVWAIGERVKYLLSDIGYAPTNLFSVPNSVNAITPLVGEILLKSKEAYERGDIDEVYIFYNQSKSGIGYLPVMQKLFPLDEKWKHTINDFTWPTKNICQIAGDVKLTLLALIHEYLFVSLFKACAESLASENACRLESMRRAEKSINDLLVDLGIQYNGLRQSSIDEELFDVISGFEALKKDKVHILRKDFPVLQTDDLIIDLEEALKKV